MRVALLSTIFSRDVALLICSHAAAAVIQRHARGRHVRCKRPPMDKYGFTRTDGGDFVYGGDSFLDALQKLCATMRGSVSIEVRLELAHAVPSKCMLCR